MFLQPHPTIQDKTVIITTLGLVLKYRAVPCLISAGSIKETSLVLVTLVQQHCQWQVNAM